MSDKFNVIFRGDILPGHTLPDVKAKMAQLFKLDDARLAAIFSGKPVALKKDCDQATAEKLKAILNNAGAEIELKSSAPPQQKAAPVPEPVAPTAAPPPTPEPPPPASSSQPAAPAPVEPAPAPPPVEAVAGEISLAPAKSEVLSEAEREAQRAAPMQVDTSHIKLEGNKATFGPVDEDEPAASSTAPETTPISAPDFGLFEAGADLLKDDEKTIIEEVELDLSNLEVAEVGADVLTEAEREHVTPVQVEDLNVDLAPPGSDMGEIKKEAPPPPPNTDHLSVT